MKVGPLPILVGLLGAFGILAAGGVSVAVCTLAAITGGAFADLARRARRETPSTVNDATDLWSSLGFFAILVAAAFDLGRSAAGRSMPLDWTLRFAGTAVIIAGAILRGAAARSLGASFAVRLGTREDQRLVDSGPYRWIRHPNYAGLLLVGLGTALGLRSPFAFAATAGFWLPIVVVRIAREERMLSERFGRAYAAYQRRTWRLVPGVY